MSANQNEKRAAIASQGVLVAETGSSFASSTASVFTSLLHATGEIARLVFYPIKILIDLVETTLTARQLYLAKNKNITRWAKLLYQITTSALFLTAVIGTLAASVVFVVVTPILLAVAAGISFLYNFGGTCINLYKWIVTPKTSEAKKIYGEQLKKYFIATLLSGLAFASAILITTVHISLPVMSAVIATAAFAATIYQTVKLYKLIKNNAVKESALSVKHGEQEEKANAQTPDETSSLIIKTRHGQSLFGRLTYDEFAYERQGSLVKENIECYREELLNAIEQHKVGIQKQIENGKNNWFASTFENKSRENKVELLDHLIRYIKDDPISPEEKADCVALNQGTKSLNEVISIKNLIKKGGFQSFFYERGGVESLYHLSDDYFKAKTNIEIEQKQEEKIKNTLNLSQERERLLEDSLALETTPKLENDVVENIKDYLEASEEEKNELTENSKISSSFDDDLSNKPDENASDDKRFE